VDYDFLPVEGRVLVRHHAYPPAGGVGCPVARQAEHLGRRAVLAAFAEGAGVELLLRLWLEDGGAGAGTRRPAWRDYHEPPGERVDPELGQEGRCRSMNGVIRSMGAGKTIVVDCDEPSSSSVCR